MLRRRHLFDRRRHHKSKNLATCEQWTSLSIDLILEIFLHLDPAAVVCCAGVCKTWRRAIIDSASIIGPHLDRFFGTNLLLGVFHFNTSAAWLRRTTGPFRSALRSNGAGSNDLIPANHLIPAATSVAIPRLLWSRDGFILLRARDAKSPCLCNPVTRYCKIVPDAPAKHNKYFLLTGSGSSSHDDPEVRILAVRRDDNSRHSSIVSLDHETLPYRILSTSGERAGLWARVVHCSRGKAKGLCVRIDRRSTAIDERDIVYWLAGPRDEVSCVFALDVCTGRTWITELPKQCHFPTIDPSSSASILAMTGDGRLSLLRSLLGARIRVSVLSGDDQWTFQRTILIDNHNQMGNRCSTRDIPYLCAFCPRSMCVIALWSYLELHVDIEGDGSQPHIRQIWSPSGSDCWPYELDCSLTYISKMKQF